VAAVIAWVSDERHDARWHLEKVSLPLGKYAHAANAAGTALTHPVQYARGQAGVKVGQ